MQRKTDPVRVFLVLFILLAAGTLVIFLVLVNENARTGQSTDLTTILFAPFVSSSDGSGRQPETVVAGYELTGEPAQTGGEPVVFLTPEYNPVVDVWASPPDCVSRPLNAAEWQNALADPANAGAGFTGPDQVTEAAERAAMIAPPPLTLEPEDTLSLLAPGSDPLPAARTALLLNIASGRLNRATEIKLPELPDVKTVGELLDLAVAELGPAGDQQTAAPTDDAYKNLSTALQKVQSGIGIIRPVCAHIIANQVGREPGSLLWSSEGIRAAGGVQTVPDLLASKIIGGGVASPDGHWAAFMTGGSGAGGPPLLYNLQTHEWINLIQRINENLNQAQLDLSEDSFWDVIGWFPDSRRLVIGSLDFASVMVVDILSFEAVPIPLSGGIGTPVAVGLSPDGSRMVYVGTTPEGTQALIAYDFASQTNAALLEWPYDRGILQHPRISPDGQLLAYVVQKEQPDEGITYAIHLFDFASGESTALVRENPGATVPAWSPDSRFLAFEKDDHPEPEIVQPDSLPQPPQGNIWVIDVHNGEQIQMTYLSGQAREPQWSFDGKTLLFLTHIGQVGMVSLDLPGQIWEVVPSSASFPLLTNALFIP